MYKDIWIYFKLNKAKLNYYIENFNYNLKNNL